MSLIKIKMRPNMFAIIGQERRLGKKDCLVTRVCDSRRAAKRAHVSVLGFVSVLVSVILPVNADCKKRPGNGSAPKSCILSSWVVQSWTPKNHETTLGPGFSNP